MRNSFFKEPVEEELVFSIYGYHNFGVIFCWFDKFLDA